MNSRSRPRAFSQCTGSACGEKPASSAVPMTSAMEMALRATAENDSGAGG